MTSPKDRTRKSEWCKHTSNTKYGRRGVNKSVRQEAKKSAKNALDADRK